MSGGTIRVLVPYKLPPSPWQPDRAEGDIASIFLENEAVQPIRVAHIATVQEERGEPWSTYGRVSGFVLQSLTAQATPLISAYT